MTHVLHVQNKLSGLIEASLLLVFLIIPHLIQNLKIPRDFWKFPLIPCKVILARYSSSYLALTKRGNFSWLHSAWDLRWSPPPRAASSSETSPPGLKGRAVWAWAVTVVWHNLPEFLLLTTLEGPSPQGNAYSDFHPHDIWETNWCLIGIKRILFHLVIFLHFYYAEYYTIHYTIDFFIQKKWWIWGNLQHLLKLNQIKLILSPGNTSVLSFHYSKSYRKFVLI